jgi:dCMP deaminase
MDKLNNIISLVNNWDNDSRLSWNEYFLATAFLISSRSPDKRLRVGCVLVKDNHIISVGYNGFLPKLEHKSHIENGHEQATVHAEQNCISDCAKRGVKTEGATAYITHYPCINCFKILASSGIAIIYFRENYKNHHLVNFLAEQANIKIIKIENNLEIKTDTRTDTRLEPKINHRSDNLLNNENKENKKNDDFLNYKFF